MKLILMVTIGFLLSSTSCNTAKTDNAQAAKDTMMISNAVDTPTVKILDSVPSQTAAAKEKQVNKTTPAKAVRGNAKISDCIKSLIESFKKEEKQNPARSVYSYKYKGKTVFYVPAVCCDKFSDLYDNNCKLIAHPDGGLTGKGDGKEKDFSTLRVDEKLLWHDKRK